MGVDMSKLSEEMAEGIHAMSDDELILRIETRGNANYSGLQFELERRFTDRLVKAIGAGKVAAWAMVMVTALLVIVTALLTFATWRLGS
jgi:hypothetical protein